MINEDEIRQKVLEFLYDFNVKRAQWTIPSHAYIEIRKTVDNLDRQQALRNINYLVDEGYIKKTIERANSMSFDKIRISSKGIQVFETTKFVAQKKFSSISLKGDNNVVVLGDNLGSITQTKGNLIIELNKLIELTKQSSFTDEEKMNLIGDVETIKAQLIKPKALPSVIQTAWAAINVAATFSSAHDLLLKIRGSLLGLGVRL